MKKMLRTARYSVLCCVLFISPVSHYALADTVSYHRVISLGPTLTEEIYALGAGERLIGCTTYCTRPKEAANKERVGTVVEINVEKIAALEPDLVLATPMTDPRSVRKLKKLGINVETFDMVKDFDELCGQFTYLGGLLGEEEKAALIVADARERVRHISSRTKDLTPRKVFVQIGTKPLFAANRETFINSIIEYSGGTNIVTGSKSGIYSREKVIKSDPDVIIIATMGLAGEREKEVWESYDTLRAAKNNKIFIVDPYLFCGATPENFVAALKSTMEMLYADDE